MAKSERKHSGLIGARRAMRTAAPISLTELRDIVGHWADAALQLCESDLKLMTRLASAQARLAKAG
jgi:DSF synthase